MSLALEAPKISSRSQWNEAIVTAVTKTVDILKKDQTPPPASRAELLSFIEGQIRGRRSYPEVYPKNRFELYLTKDPTGRAYTDIFLETLNRHDILNAFAHVPEDTDPNLPGIRVTAYF